MCHGAEWEMYILAREREIARRNREKAETDNRKSTPIAPPKPAEVPSGNEEPVPV